MAVVICRGGHWVAICGSNRHFCTRCSGPAYRYVTVNWCAHFNFRGVQRCDFLNWRAWVTVALRRNVRRFAWLPNAFWNANLELAVWVNIGADRVAIFRRYRDGGTWFAGSFNGGSVFSWGYLFNHWCLGLRVWHLRSFRLAGLVVVSLGGSNVAAFWCVRQGNIGDILTIITSSDCNWGPSFWCQRHGRTWFASPTNWNNA